MDRVERILVLQLGGIGDVLLIFPLVRALKQAFPDKLIITVTEYGNWLFELAPDLTEGIIHQRLDLSGNYRGKLHQIQEISREGIDLIVSPARGDGVIESSGIAWLTGAPLRIGFSQEGSKFFYTHTCEFSYQDPIVEQNLNLLHLLQCSAAESTLSLELEENAELEGRRIVMQNRRGNGFSIVFHPFAGNFAELKVWPVIRYAQLAEKLIAEYSANIFILGSSDDRDHWDAVCPVNLKHKLINLCGELSFPIAAAVIKNSNLFIGNDSSLLHLAESFAVPAIGIFGATSPSQLLPREHNTVIASHGVSCGPCYLHQPLHRHRCEDDIACLKGIGVQDVFAAALTIMTRSGRVK